VFARKAASWLIVALGVLVGLLALSLSGQRWIPDRATDPYWYKSCIQTAGICLLGMTFIVGSLLGASKAHRHFVKETKRAVGKMAWQLPFGAISPTSVGAEPLPLAVPPTLERAFGYRGTCDSCSSGIRPVVVNLATATAGTICGQTRVCGPGFSTIQSSLRTCPRIVVWSDGSLE